MMKWEIGKDPLGTLTLRIEINWRDWMHIRLDGFEKAMLSEIDSLDDLKLSDVLLAMEVLARRYEEQTQKS